MSVLEAEHRAPSRRRVAAGLLGLAQFGHAHWFFGNLYEGIVKVPELLASHDAHGGRQPVVSPLAPGSPVRYYAAAAPATLPAVIAAVGFGWDGRNSRPWLVTAAACSVFGGGATAYVVRAVNVKLFFSTQPHTAAEQEILLRRWHGVNAIRLIAAGGAWLAAHKAKARLLQ